MILTKVADYITELLSIGPEQVLIGRENATIETFENDFIVVDSLTPALPISTNREYDKENEIESFVTFLEMKVTLEFYGANAYSNAFKFLNLQNSQLARDLQKKYEITLYKTGSINNLKQIVGDRYFERYEVELKVQFVEKTSIETLRIDEIVLDEILNNE